jgi:hypothetical protein
MELQHLAYRLFRLISHGTGIWCCDANYSRWVALVFYDRKENQPT